MAYGLRYYKELTHPDGKVVRLEILERNGSLPAREIGPVCQALRLDIQGDTEIDAPIVKTSLSMTFVDASDHPDANVKKCGNWDEFYTSDATLWQVLLKVKKSKNGAFSTIWGGYITPDSYTEVLQYRGSVTIVARDNIGHMNDFPFDAKGDAHGMITLRELIELAWAKIDSPMEVMFDGNDWMVTDGVEAFNTMMNVSAFEGMTWFEALESALYSYGAAMRWIGGCEVMVRPLRWIPLGGRYSSQSLTRKTPKFLLGAERELSPAAKMIEESLTYDLRQKRTIPLASSVSFSDQASTIPFESKNLFDEVKMVDIPTWPITNKTNEGWGNGDKTLFLNPNKYSTTGLSGTLGDSLVLATNTDGSGRVWYGEYVQGRSLTVSMTFGQMIAMFNKTALTTILLIPVIAKTVEASISATANGITNYLNEEGSWQTDEVFLQIPINEETRTMTKAVPVGSFSTSEVLIKLTIKNIKLGSREGNPWWDTSDGNGIYVELSSLKIADNSGIALCKKNIVNTNYDLRNNIILSREPKLGPALNDVLSPAFIVNGIFVKQGNVFKPTKTWSWDEDGVKQQMAVYNHLQLLCYHAKPNNILRGTIVNADISDLNVIWNWANAEHILVSGSLNFINGYIENAVLREFEWYDQMWGDMGEADFPNIQGRTITNVEEDPEDKNIDSPTYTTEIIINGGEIVLDDMMSDTSTNGVQNRVIKAYVDSTRDDLNERIDHIEGDLNEVASLWKVDEDGNLWTDRNVYSTKEISAGGVGEEGEEEGDYDIVIDTEMSDFSENAVQNKVIKKYVDDRFDDIVIPEGGGGGGVIDLSDYAKKRDLKLLEDRVTKNEQDIADLKENGGGGGGVALNELQEWYQRVGNKIDCDENGLHTDENFRSSKEISAGGAGEEADTPVSGTVTAVKVDDGEPIYPDNDGVVDISDALEGVVKELDLENYAKKDDLNALAGRVTRTEEKNIEQDNSLTTIKDDLNTIVKWYDKVAKHLDVEGETLHVDLNIATPKEVSAGGVGEEGEIIEGDVYRMFHHKQTQPSAEWKIYHGLGKYPNVKIVDTLKQLCLGDVYYDDENNVTIKFGGAESGDAYLD